MQRLAVFIGALAIALATAGSYLGASFLADMIERGSAETVTKALKDEGFDWARIRTDGLIVHMSGEAPDEAGRFKALAIVKNTVNEARVEDAITIATPADLYAPKFSLELLRNGDGISLIGLLPQKTGRNRVLNSIDDVDDETHVTDMLETADYPEPDGWVEALEYALSSLRLLPRSKISVTPSDVVIIAITDSQAEKTKIESDLNSASPAGLNVTLKISAPRPVITPFSLRLTMGVDGTRFDSCSADSEAARSRILLSAQAAGAPKDTPCVVGLGVPSPRWAEAVEYGIQAIMELDGGSLTFSDADITIVATEQTRQIDFDRIVHNLEQALPDVFSVHAILPPKPDLEGDGSEPEKPEFMATKSPEGLVQMRGRLRDNRTQTSINNFAKAQFGGDNVHDTTRIDSSLPDGWPIRVLAGLEALAKLHHGMLMVQDETLEVRGISDHPDRRTEITQILADKLGDVIPYTISVTYEESLNREIILPTPEECVASVNAILSKQQIIFAPSSTSIEADAINVVESIAEAMTDCSDVPMEIGGHTDSQGREAMNLTLSQARAEAVLDALLSLEVLTTHLSAKGYGESKPIADNDTEEGRRANRRIEFLLIKDEQQEATGEEPTAQAETNAEAATGDADTAAPESETPETAADEATAPAAGAENENQEDSNGQD